MPSGSDCQTLTERSAPGPCGLSETDVSQTAALDLLTRQVARTATPGQASGAVLTDLTFGIGSDQIRSDHAGRGHGQATARRLRAGATDWLDECHRICVRSH